MSPTDLETLIAAERPAPRAAWAEELDARAAAGFPGPERPRPERRRLPRVPRLSLGPALAGVAALVVAVVVAGSLLGGHREGTPSFAEPASAPAIHAPARGAAGEASSGTVTSSADSAAAAPAAPAARRQVERTSQLTVAVRPRRLQAAAQRVYTIVAGFGGIVDSSAVSSGGPSGSANFALRVPAGRLGLVLGRLSGLGRLRSQTGTTRDVTGSFISARERLARARAERSGLLRALARATSATAIDALKERVRLAEGEVAAARRGIAGLRDRVDFARVDLSLVAGGPVAAPTHHGGGGLTPSRALRDAGRILRGALAVAIIVLAILIPFVALGLAGAASGRVVRRRRREAALG